jgi:hypothetical protein
MGPQQYREQPGARRRRLPQLVKPGERPEGRILEQILGVRLVPPAQPKRRPEQRVQMLGEDLLESTLWALRSSQKSIPLSG